MLDKTLKQDDLLMKTLDIKIINRLICFTDKGQLSLQIRKGEQNYHLCLDSVPVEKELNRTLMSQLFPIPKQEVPQVNKVPPIVSVNTIKISKEDMTKVQKGQAITIPVSAKRGRPVGSARTK